MEYGGYMLANHTNSLYMQPNEYFPIKFKSGLKYKKKCEALI